MFALYLDDSGHIDNTRILAVGGFLATAEQWAAFTEAWRAELRAEKVPAYRSATLEAGAPPFRGWSTARKGAFRRRLAGVISAHGLRGVGRGVDVGAFRRTPGLDVLFMGGTGLPMLHHLAFLIRGCMEWASDTATPGETVSVTFEAGTLHLDESLLYCRWLRDRAPWGGRFGTVADAPKNKLVALQAADYVAFETYKRCGQVLDRPRLMRSPRAMRPALHHIRKQTNIKIWLEPDLREMAADLSDRWRRPSRFRGRRGPGRS